tara:strand:+ start:8089 stop:8427 length:339 start_codon:yes stop_codon:yes gene_type:complete
MNTIIKKWGKIFLISCIVSSFLISGSSVWGENYQEGQFRISGVIKSVNVVRRSFVFEEGETLHVTIDTVYKNLKNETISFTQLIQPGKIVLVLTEIIEGRYVAISVKETSVG